MGFPLGYSELIIPKPLLQIVLFFNLLRRILVRFLDAVGLGDLLESDDVLPLEPPTDAPLTVRSVTAMLIQDMLPVVLFKDLLDGRRRRNPIDGPWRTPAPSASTNSNHGGGPAAEQLPARLPPLLPRSVDGDRSANLPSLPRAARSRGVAGGLPPPPVGSHCGRRRCRLR
ncbi:hypothetical protein HPP92_028534 [Vanilla planifolia]|uniref:Uncharacterized protein n=1 Tax=Vanilla planifolia TaxID=51239 RepID=A0A835P717_VANPL|nr:hypothetical protein HPP92_028534 [Vanilla planifolia]